jgi:hypothetical protein
MAKKVKSWQTKEFRSFTKSETKQMSQEWGYTPTLIRKSKKGGWVVLGIRIGK